MEASQDKPDAKGEGKPAEQPRRKRRRFQFHLSRAPYGTFVCVAVEVAVEVEVAMGIFVGAGVSTLIDPQPNKRNKQTATKTNRITRLTR